MRTRRHRERNVTFCCVSPCYLDSNEDSGFLTLFLYAFCWCEWELKTLLFFFPPQLPPVCDIPDTSPSAAVWSPWLESSCATWQHGGGSAGGPRPITLTGRWAVHSDKAKQDKTKLVEKKNILVSLWKKVIIIKWESNVLDKKWHGIEKSTIAWYTVTIMR